jgi:site-specific DNA-methyltransferase (adenine-specific)
MLKDCMEFMRELPDKHYDLAIVDPPYGIERFKKGGSHINKYGSNTGLWNNDKPSNEYFLELDRVSSKMIIWGGNNFKLPETEYFIIWQKSNAENFSFAMCEMAWTNCKKPAKIFTHYHSSTNDKRRIHPTQKPVELYKWLLTNYAKPGDKILDTHGGSGSICIACHDLGFDLDWMEKDEDYFRDAKKRYEEHARQQLLFV